MAAKEEFNALTMATTAELITELSRRTDTLIVGYTTTVKTSEVGLHISGSNAIAILGLSRFVHHSVTRKIMRGLQTSDD